MMLNQEFLDRDFRKDRPLSLGMPMTAELNNRRHQLLLPSTVIQGKSILDLGSFLAQTGDWCLNNGARSYQGVEMNPDFALQSIEMLQKYHANATWKIHRIDIDSFFRQNNERFDLIFCWGVLFGVTDHFEFLKALCARTDHIILESRHPKLLLQKLNCARDIIEWMEYHSAYTEYHDGDQTVMIDRGLSARCAAANSSIGALRIMAGLQGFDLDHSVYDQLKTEFPHHFGLIPDRLGRFVISLEKNENKGPVPLENIAHDPDGHRERLVRW